ncbi:peptidase [Saccharopolyspora sp. WRP15-2]|uniref:Peptidase n=2 Tax=Saccharopolyspora oryzae TaxID=2997343 RepID=A0ABT4V3W5_9PSEU|nr:peptidase [Saccharopolyspora oryzae]
MMILLLISSCAAAPPEPPRVADHTVDPGFVHGTDQGDVDRLAATAVTDVQDYWAAQFPAVFGKPWRNLDGGFFSVDTNGSGTAPPCSADVRDLEGNAYYCATVDAIAWDRAALLPVLREHYGDAAVVVVLAHELGHAVQQRAGIGADAAPVRLEAMADCFSGSYVRSVVDGRSARLRVDAEQLDRALRAITLFRDPVSTNSTDAHGTAFERVTAFQDGFANGPRRCTEVTETPMAGLPPDGPNAPLDQALRTDGISQYFSDLVAQHGARWTPPAVDLDRTALARVHADIGDQAVTTLLAAKYARAANAELGRPTTGEQTMCLTGAYTAAQPGLSQGDLDEAVSVVLDSDDIARPLTGFDRISAFRSGVLGGATACR